MPYHIGNVMSDLEFSERSCSFGVDDTLWDPFSIEVCEKIDKMKILEKDGAVIAYCLRSCGEGNGSAIGGRINWTCGCRHCDVRECNESECMACPCSRWDCFRIRCRGVLVRSIFIDICLPTSAEMFQSDPETHQDVRTVSEGFCLPLLSSARLRYAC